MNNIIHLSDDVWSEIGSWKVAPKGVKHLDHSSISFNHDDRDTYMLFSESLLETNGLSCLEFHILIKLFREGNDIQDLFMLDFPFLICGSEGLTQEQLDAEPPEATLYESAPLEYLDQPKVLEAILNLEKKGLIIISRDKS